MAELPLLADRPSEVPPDPAAVSVCHTEFTEELRGLGLVLAAVGLIGWFQGSHWNMSPPVAHFTRTWLGSYLVGFGLLLASLAHGILRVG